MSLDLRPLTLGELFDRAFMLYRRHFWLFVGIAALPGVFALLLNLVQQMMQNVSQGMMAAGEADPDAVLAQMSWLFAGVMLSLLLYSIVYMIALGATTFAVSELYLGRSTGIHESYGRMRGRIGRLLVLMLVIALRVGGVVVLGFLGLGVAVAIAAVTSPIVAGLGAVLVAGLIAVVTFLLLLRYAVSVPALVLEGLGVRAAIRRSIGLTRGRLGRVFLLVLCATMVTYAATILLQGPFIAGAMVAGPGTSTALWLNIAGAVTGTIGTTLTAPFMIIGLALLYYDARIREEGFDLELSLAALDGAPAPSRG